MNSTLIKYCFTNSQKLQAFVPKKKPTNTIFPLRPRQHPKHWLTKQVSIYKAEKPVYYLNEPQTIPKTLYVEPSAIEDFPTAKIADQIVSRQTFTQGLTSNPAPSNQRFLQAVIVGPPNSGKSTFLNKFVGQELSAVSNKSNTTSAAIVGIHTNYDQRIQIEFKDTPGITKRYKYSRHFVTKAWEELDDTDAILFMVDGVKTLEDSVKEAIKRLNTIKPPQHEKIISDSNKVSKLLIINKMDLCFNKKKLRWLLAELEDLTKFDQVFYLSTLTGYGMEDLKNYLYDLAKDCDWRYKDNVKTTLHPIDQIEQMVKQAIFKRFFYEVPFLTSIQMNEFHVRSDGSGRFEFTLGTQSTNQAKMLVGEKGQNIKIMSNEVNLQLVKTFRKEFDVSISVVVRKGDYQETIEAQKDQEMAEVVQGQSQTKIQGDMDYEKLKGRRARMGQIFQHFINQ